MKTPEQLLGAPLWAKMLDAYREWARQDEFGGHFYYAGNPAPEFYVSSVRQLLENLFMFTSQHGLWNGRKRVPFDLNTTLAHLLSLVLRNEQGGFAPLEYVSYKALCLDQVQPLLSQGSSVSAGDYKAVLAGLMQPAGCKRWSTLERRLKLPGNANVIARELQRVLLQELSGKTLWDFFKASRRPCGYFSWWPEVFTGVGTPLTPSLKATGSAQVAMQVTRYPAEDTGSNVKAYEWAAELRQVHDSELPDAVATGMVYELKRKQGVLLSTASDLRWAADAIADSDVEQVLAFLQQHKDADELMSRGELCFVWLWERRSDAHPGLGAELLSAALADLKRRFRGLYTIVVRLRPAQFLAAAGAHEPPEVQVARQEATERLEHYLHTLAPQNAIRCELRLTTSRPQSAEETLCALGAADVIDRLRDADVFGDDDLDLGELLEDG